MSRDFKHSNKRYFIIAFTAFTLLSLLSAILLITSNKEIQPADIGTSVRTEDGFIQIQWEDRNHAIKYICITGNGCDEHIVPNGLNGTYSFNSGAHGEMYTISFLGRDSAILMQHQKLFLNYNELPKLPLLIIETNEEPSFTKAEKPYDYCFGESITKNYYVNGNMFFQSSEQRFANEISIKVRGNTSALASEKVPYKLKLASECDLLSSGKPQKEWILLPYGNSLKPYLASCLAISLGIQNQPLLIQVNVLLNGDWRGCYYLCETVEEALSEKLDSLNAGILFENDAYWWNSDFFFMTDRQQEFNENHMGTTAYTVKKPKWSKLDSSQISDLQSFLNEAEMCLYTGTEDIFSYYDIAELANILLVHDIIGNIDGAGMNMFFYFDLDSKNSQDCKVHMGPLWDYDNTFGMEDVFSFSGWHALSTVFFPDLLQSNQYFIDAYKAAWESKKGDVEGIVLSLLDKVPAEELNESCLLNYSRWGGEYLPVEYEVEQLKKYIELRMEWLNISIPDISKTISIYNDRDNNRLLVELFNGKEYEQVEFPIWTVENGQDDLTWYSGEMNAEGNWQVIVNTANQFGKTDVYEIHVYATANNERYLVGKLQYPCSGG